MFPGYPWAGPFRRARGAAWMRMQFAKKLFPQHTIKGPP